MPKFRKKPVVIEAVQWSGNNAKELLGWAGDNGVWGADFQIDIENGLVEILTLEGVMSADVGDWVIKGIRGEFYPCKPDIFEETYELVDDSLREFNTT